jgi:hypothetical protein
MHLSRSAAYGDFCLYALYAVISLFDATHGVALDVALFYLCRTGPTSDRWLNLVNYVVILMSGEQAGVLWLVMPQECRYDEQETCGQSAVWSFSRAFDENHEKSTAQAHY